MFSVPSGVYTCMCAQIVCVLHNYTQNNMEQEEKGIFIGDENMVKCATDHI